MKRLRLMHTEKSVGVSCVTVTNEWLDIVSQQTLIQTIRTSTRGAKKDSSCRWSYPQLGDGTANIAYWLKHIDFNLRKEDERL